MKTCICPLIMRGLLIFVLSMGFWVIGCATPQTAPPQSTHATHPAANEAIITIDGMACPFCVYNVEKKVREIPTVERVSIDLESGTAHVVFDSSSKPDLKAMWDKVIKSGFTPRKIVTQNGVYYGQ